MKLGQIFLQHQLLMEWMLRHASSRHPARLPDLEATIVILGTHFHFADALPRYHYQPPRTRRLCLLVTRSLVTVV